MSRAKRHRRLGTPAPLPTLGTLPAGCLLPLLAPAVLALLLVRYDRWALGLGAGVLVVALAAPWLAGRARARSAIAALRAEGKRGVVVTSDSPIWGPYIAHRWLPRLGPGFAVLNWSARAAWPDTAAVRLWRQLTGRRHFNPVVILLQDAGPPLLYAFYPWFQAAKHGERSGLEALEADLLARLEK